MKKKIILIFLFAVLIANPCFALDGEMLLASFIQQRQMGLISQQGTESVDPLGCDCSNGQTVCWHGNNETLTSETPYAGCSDGDTTATAQGDATISDGWLVFPDGDDYYTLAISGGDLAAPEAFSIQFEIYAETWLTNTRTFYFDNATGHYILVWMIGGSSSDIEFRARSYDGTNDAIANTTDANRGEGAAMLVRARFRETGTPNVDIVVCDINGTNCCTVATNDTDYDWTSSDGERFKVGNHDGSVAANIKIRNLKARLGWYVW